MSVGLHTAAALLSEPAYGSTCWLGLGLGEGCGLGLGQPSAPDIEPMLSTQSSGIPGDATRAGLGGVAIVLSPEERGEKGDLGGLPLGSSTGSQESLVPLTCIETGTCARSRSCQITSQQLLSCCCSCLTSKGRRKIWDLGGLPLGSSTGSQESLVPLTCIETGTCTSSTCLQTSARVLL